MSALRRVLRAPGLWLALALLHLAVAKALAAPVGAAVQGTLTPHAFTDHGALLPALVELFVGTPALLAVIAAAWITSAVLGGLLQVVLAGGVLRRLAAPATAPEVAAAALRHLPAIAVVTLYGLIARGVLAGLLGPDLLGVGAAIPRAIVLALGLALFTHVVDLARADVVLAGARGYHPRVILRALRRAAQALPRTLGAITLWLVAAALVAATLALVARGLGHSWVAMAARLLAVLGVGVNLWRIAVAVDAVDARPKR